MRCRRLTTLLLVTLLVAFVSGNAFAGKTVIKFWHIWDGGEAQKFIKEVVEEFNETHPDIEVQDLGINFWDYWTKIATATAAGIAPDVAMNDLGNVGQRADAGMIISLDDLMAEDGVSVDNFWKAAHRAITWDGKVYAMPIETDVRVLYYNKAAFREVGLDPEKPPTTWDELEEYAELLTKRDENDKLVRVGFCPTWGNTYFWVYAWQNGGDFVDEEGNIQIYSPENVEALEWMLEQMEKYGIRDLTSFSSTFGGGAMDPFLVGKVAMIVQNNTFRSTIHQYAPDLEFGVAQLPHNGTPASWSNGFSLEISSQSKHPEAAWEFVKYLMSEEVQKEYAVRNSSLVGNKAAAMAPELVEDPVWQTILDQMEVSKFRPFSLKVPTWYDGCLVPEIDAVLQGMKEPEEALKAAQKAYEDEVRRYDRTHRK